MPEGAVILVIVKILPSTSVAWLSNVDSLITKVPSSATDKLTGNMPTENLLSYFDQRNIEHGLDKDAFVEAMRIANTIFK